MSKQEQSETSEGRPELPIERGFPIERVNEIAEKESRAKKHYRPIYTMHKWWARRPGCLFRAITLYSLLDEDTEIEDVNLYEPGKNSTLGSNGISSDDLINSINDVNMENPEPLWDFYPKDVRIKNKKVLDPFMGGGTSLVEASRFGVESVGVDLNPVAWFVNKKQLEASETAAEDIKEAFNRLSEEVEEELKQYYKTPCPSGNHKADVMYNFWVKELDCVSCDNKISLFKDYRVAKGRYDNDDKYNVLCPDCEQIILVDDWKSECTCDANVGNSKCGNTFVPKNGNVSRGSYTCPQCGQKHSISDAVLERNGFDLRPYAIEYYCTHCDDQGGSRSDYKGYKEIEQHDHDLINKAKKEWENSGDLKEYVPDGEIREGWYTASTQFSGSAPGAHDIFEHGYEQWVDLYNPRQLLCLSTLLKSIENIGDKDVREYLLLAFSDSLMFQNMFSIYNMPANKIEGIFRMNAYVPQSEIVENNVWGTRAGRGTFVNTVEKMLSGVEYASNPTERYVDKDGNSKESAPFAQPIGKNTTIYRDDMRSITAEDEFDAVITDPPYYDNVMYSELADYFYVWQRLLLADDYEEFRPENTPRKESIVANPAENKTVDDFEAEIGEAFDTIHQTLKEKGTLAFTYHHSDEESWGELLESLCDSGFEVTATYPINSDLSKFIEAREAVAFDIVIVARPVEERTPISWNSLRRQIVRTAQRTRDTLEENRSLSSGDIGVIEMGKCFQEYSKHHGEIRGSREGMTAKEVVQEIYGIIQEGDRGEQDVYLDLLEEWKPKYDSLNKHLKRSDASEESMRDMRLFRIEDNEFTLTDWKDEKRQAYVQDKVDGGNGDLTALDKAHFLRYRYEHDRSREEYLSRWDTDELQELCEDLATITGDETYLKMLGVDTTLAEISDK
jgi:adenine-specific DNA methylase